jgi:hypothetical protein
MDAWQLRCIKLSCEIGKKERKKGRKGRREEGKNNDGAST